MTEIGPELALFAHRATSAPVVLASHWMAGAATMLGLNDRAPASPKLYLPELLSDSKWFLDELRSAGAIISEDFK